MKELYTHSRLASYRACPRKHYYAYELGAREARPAAALAFGTAFHDGARAYWEMRKAWPKSSSEERFFEVSGALDRKPLPDPFDRVKLNAMLSAYVVLWDNWGVDVVAIEQPFRIPLRDPDTHEAHPRAMLGGQMDLLLRSGRTGNLAVVEHKSSSRDVSPGSEYVLRLKIDSQIGIYFHAVSALGMDAVEVIYDVATKPPQRPLKGGKTKPAETPEEYGDRVMTAISASPEAYIKRIRIARPDREQEEVWRDVWSWVGKIERSAADGDWPRNTDNCFKWGSPCPYFSVCTGRASIDDPVVYIRKGKHVELVDEADRTATVDSELEF